VNGFDLKEMYVPIFHFVWLNFKKGEEL